MLVIDVCPQANISALFLGGLTFGRGTVLLNRQGAVPRASIGGYFQARLPSPYAPPPFAARDFLTTPNQINEAIPANIDLLCGDPLLELQSNAINTLSNNQIPGTDTWIMVIDWLKDFLAQVAREYDAVFIDANPSFSIYAQIALSVVDRLILPVMADDSSRRAIQNAFSLIYGLKLPSEIYASYAFATKLANAKRSLPKVNIIAKNRITQYMGSASAYAAVLRSVDQDLEALLRVHPEIFTFQTSDQGVVEIRDFQTTGVVAFARGCPFYSVQPGRLDVGGRRVRVNESMRSLCEDAIDKIVDRL